MLVTLAFGYPFNGRVYVNGNYEVTNRFSYEPFAKAR